MNLLRLMVASCAVAAALPSVGGDGRAETPELTLEVNATNASFRVTDRRTGRTWESEPQYPHMPQNLAVTGCEVVDREIRLTMTASGGRNLSATFRLEPEPGEMTVTFDTGWRYKKEWEMAFPGPLRSKRGDRLIVPLNEGMGYPVEGESEGLRNLAGFSGHGLSMGFFGVVADEGGAGWMAIVEEAPEDMRMEVFRLGEEQLLSAGARWISENRVIGYPRRLRFVFFASGGHVAMCKRYRRYAKEKGYLKTFREKAKIRPDVLKLPGSVNIWYFRKDQAAMAKELHDAGIERMLWSGGKHTDASNVTEIAKIPGVLVGRYDLYQGVYPPELAAKCGGGAIGYNPEAWPDDILWSGPTSNDWRRGWEVKAKDGTKHKLAMLCPAKAPDYARRKIPPDLAERPYNARFLDTTCSSQWFECLNPAHPLTRRQCHLKRLELLGVLSDELKLVTGTENGHESAVPVCDYFEGMMSISPYTLPDCGRNMDVIWTNALPALTAKYSMNEKLRLPLWELVFHDCVCNEYYWGDYNNKMPQLWYRKDVFNLLYGTMPMFMFNRNLWKARKGTFLRSYRMCEPVARATGFSEMVDHRFLVQDRSVQETEFADGTVVTVNFSPKPFRCRDGYEIPRYEYRVRLPPRPEGCYMRDAQKEVDFSPAATYPGFKVDTHVESRGNVRLHNVRLEHLGTGDRAMTFTYDIPLPEGPITAFTGPDQQRTLKYWEAPAEMDTRACEAGAGRLPRWPFLAVKAADGTHALGLAPGSVAIYRLSVDPARRILRVAFDLGFTPEHRDASFAFATFSFDAEAEAGYRGAWKVWMEAFPDSYTVRDRTHGTWMVHLPIGEVKGWEDFGFRYKEGYKDAAWDRAHGVRPLRYTSSGAWSMRYIEKKVKDVTKATYEDAFAEALSQVARKVPKALSWKDCRMLDANGKPAGMCLNQGWGQGWTWSVNSAPGIQGESTDFSQKASKDVLSQWHDEGQAKFPLGGEYYDSSTMYMTVQLDYDRRHFAAMRTPLTYAKDTFRPVIHKGMMGFEYLKSIADGMHARGKIVMANGAPSVWCWVPQLCDVLGSEANWLRGGKWTPPRRDGLILIRMQCGGKPYCVIQNTDFAAFGPYVERYMQLCLAYGFLPGFFSPKSAVDGSHYFRHPEFYERDRALFRKYLPLCRLLSESGWRPVNVLAPQTARGDVSAEQFGDRYVALYNHSQTAAAEVEVPDARERVTGIDVRGRISLPPMECRVLEVLTTQNQASAVR